MHFNHPIERPFETNSEYYYFCIDGNTRYISADKRLYIKFYSFEFIELNCFSIQVRCWGSLENQWLNDNQVVQIAMLTLSLGFNKYILTVTAKTWTNYYTHKCASEWPLEQNKSQRQHKNSERSKRENFTNYFDHRRCTVGLDFFSFTIIIDIVIVPWTFWSRFFFKK